MITIITDGSHCRHTHAAGYAGWVKADGREPLWVHGPIDRLVHGSAIAEIVAVERSLTAAVRSGIVRADDRVLFRTDSREALASIGLLVPTSEILASLDGMPTLNRAKKLARSLRECPELPAIAAMCERLRLHVALQPVKGHTGSVSGDCGINEECDRRARAGMRQARAKSIGR